jgi:hypothetical protein
MEFSEILLPSIETSSDMKRMTAVGPHQVVLEIQEVLGNLQALAIAAERELVEENDRRDRIVEGRSIYPDIRIVEGLVLISRGELPVKGDLGLVQQSIAE